MTMDTLPCSTYSEPSTLDPDASQSTQVKASVSDHRLIRLEQNDRSVVLTPFELNALVHLVEASQ